MLIYSISTGELTNLQNGVTSKICDGYSGLLECKNRASACTVKGRGPIPPGHYQIGIAFTSVESGPICMPLAPEEGTETFGRGGFEMHGDSREHPGQASHGCIILPPWARTMISKMVDRELLVVT